MRESTWHNCGLETEMSNFLISPQAHTPYRNRIKEIEENAIQL
jgi:hypothetical protein